MEAVIQLEPDDKQLELFGAGDSYLRLLRRRFDVQITARQGKLTITGKQKDIEKTVEVFQKMQKQFGKRHHLTAEDIADFTEHQALEMPADNPLAISVFSHHKVVAPSTKGQQKYIKTMLTNDLTFCIGPAGTGKFERAARLRWVM